MNKRKIRKSKQGRSGASGSSTTASWLSRFGEMRCGKESAADEAVTAGKRTLRRESDSCYFERGATTKGDGVFSFPAKTTPSFMQHDG